MIAIDGVPVIAGGHGSVKLAIGDLRGRRSHARVGPRGAVILTEYRLACLKGLRGLPQGWCLPACRRADERVPASIAGISQLLPHLTGQSSQPASAFEAVPRPVARLQRAGAKPPGRCCRRRSGPMLRGRSPHLTTRSHARKATGHATRSVGMAVGTRNVVNHDGRCGSDT